MKKSIIFASTLVLSVGFSSVVYSNKASSAASTQTLAVATKLPFSAGSVLNKGMKLTSPSGNHILVVGTDGNLVVITKNGGYVWGLDLVLPNLGQARPERLELRADGSFGAYNDKGVAVWLAPVTKKDPKVSLNLTDDGILQLVTSSEILWASNGAVGPLLKEATKLPLTAGFVLKKGTKYTSPSGNYYLTLNPDGNLVETNKDGSYIWGLDQAMPNFNQALPDHVEIKPDGSFGAYNAKGVAVWLAPVTKKDPKASLNLTYDGALQLVASNGEILWSNDGILTPRIKVFLNKANVKPCTEAGWDRCVELADPKIKIISTNGVSASAVNAVANIYTEMMNRLVPTPAAPDPKRKFDSFKVYLTNEEPWEVQSKLPVVGAMFPGQTGLKSAKVLQGGASDNYLWISEQMIAKKGVKTLLTIGINDTAYRTFDQVVHEMGHSIDRQLVDDSVVNQFDGNVNPVESFAFRIQQWFGVPAGQIPPRQEALLKKVFSSRAAFSVEGYKP